MRIDILKERLASKGIHKAILFSPESSSPNVYYFTGYRGFGFLLVGKETYLLVPPMEYERARAQSSLQVKVSAPGQRLTDAISGLIESDGKERIGIDKHSITLDVFERLRKIVKGKYVDIGQACSDIRKVKVREEIDLISKACRIGDSILKDIVSDFGFRKESEIKDFIESRTRLAGCTPSFPPIVASGKASSMPHYDGDSRIGKGFLMLDFGVKHKGYCGDMTRMLYVGAPSRQEMEDYNLLRTSQEDALKSCAIGASFKGITEKCRASLGDYSKAFIHSLGHGIGVEVHEFPIVSEMSEDKVEDGMVFTIEPGIYFEGRYGIRVEDTVAMVEGRPVALTRSTKNLVLIKR